MKYKNQKGIISIIAVLSIGMFAFGTAFIMVKGVLQQSMTNRNNNSTYQAFYTAESRGNKCVYQLRNSLPCVLGAHSDINGATSDIPVAPSFQSGYAVINATADRSDTHRNIITTIRNFPDDKGFAFDYGLYTPQVVNLGGNAAVNGNIFATEKAYCLPNKECECNPDDCQCQGSVEICGNIVKDFPAEYPTIDSVPYLVESQTDGTYFDNETDAEDYIKYNPGVDKIIFVDDTSSSSMKVQNINLNGTLWTMGNLKLTSGGTITAQEGHIALYVEGDLEISGGVTINGIIYVKGETTIGAGNIVINGSLISLGGAGIDITGTLTVNYDPSILDFWQDLVGLEDDDLYDLEYKPEFDNWDEE